MDILTPALAKELLGHPGWLNFKALSYYYKADCNAAGVVEFQEVTKLTHRLRSELGLGAVCTFDLHNEMDLCRQLCAVKRPGMKKSGRKPEEAVEPDVFEYLFAHTLTEAAAAGTSAVAFDTYAKNTGIRRLMAKVGDNFLVAL